MEQGLGGPPNDNHFMLILQQLAADYHRRIDEVRDARSSTTASTQANPQDGDAPTTTSTMASTQASLPEQ